MFSHSIRATQLALLTITLALSACSTFQVEDLDYYQIPVKDPDNNMSYGVYTPPNWSPSESLPLILFLHGSYDNHQSFERFGANDYLDEMITQGAIPRVIVVTPNGKNGFWENWYDGTHNYRSWVLNHVMPEASKNYKTRPCPEHCHIMGISMGGFGALRFAYFANTQFSSVSAISAPILNEEENKQAKESILLRLMFPLAEIFGPDFSENYAHEKIEKVWIEDKSLQNIRLQLIVGNDDRKQIMKANRRFHNLLTHHNIDHEYITYDGGHQWRDWIPNFKQAIHFLLHP